MRAAALRKGPLSPARRCKRQRAQAESKLRRRGPLGSPRLESMQVAREAPRTAVAAVAPPWTTRRSRAMPRPSVPPHSALEERAPRHQERRNAWIRGEPRPSVHRRRQSGEVQRVVPSATWCAAGRSRGDGQRALRGLPGLSGAFTERGSTLTLDSRTSARPAPGPSHAAATGSSGRCQSGSSFRRPASTPWTTPTHRGELERGRWRERWRGFGRRAACDRVHRPPSAGHHCGGRGGCGGEAARGARSRAAKGQGGARFGAVGDAGPPYLG